MNSAGPNLPAPVRKAAALARGIPDPLFLHRRSTSAEPSRPPVERSRWLAAINAIAALAITAAIAFRFAQSGMPASVMQEEAGVVAVGALYAALVIWIRSSPLVAHTGVQLLLMAANIVLAVVGLGVAGPWLGADFAPLSVGVFAAMLLYFDMGYNARHFAYVLLVAAIGLGALWADAVVNLHIAISSILVWTLVLLGLVLLAYVTHHVVDRNLVTQAGRQASLLVALSDLGEGLLQRGPILGLLSAKAGEFVIAFRIAALH